MSLEVDEVLGCEWESGVGRETLEELLLGVEGEDFTVSFLFVDYEVAVVGFELLLRVVESGHGW